MNKMSIKLKVTLWFTLLMIFIVAAILIFLIKVGEKQVYEDTILKLQSTVISSFDDIKYRFGELDIDDDLDYYNEGVYIAVYEEDGGLIYGRLPSDFDRTLPFSTGRIQTVNEGEHARYVYDAVHDAGRGYKVIVRGVLSASGSENAFAAIIRLAMIVFPVLIIVAAIVGYLISRRAFRPVEQIVSAAENINNGNDLTRRIGLKGTNNEIYRLAAEFDLMFDRLQSSFENEKRFTSDASHELRTPIAVIITQCEEALSADTGEAEMREALEVILEKSKGMSTLISSLLTLARADRGHLKLIKEPTDLSILAESVAEQAKEMAEEKNIKVISEIEPNIIVNGDETMLIRMMLNLCENGIKYGRENGQLKITLKSDGEKVIGTVEDDGIGIAPENTEKIWERFFRVDEARTNGSGLGLPLAKYIAEAHGGNITAESELGTGSCFEFSLKK